MKFPHQGERYAGTSVTAIVGKKFRGIMPASVGIVADFVRTEIRVEIEMEAIIGSAEIAD